jgi:hypothetical protein
MEKQQTKKGTLFQKLECLKVHQMAQQQSNNIRERIAVLSEEVSQLKNMFTNALSAPQANLPVKGPGAWCGPIPYLQSILCLTKDEIKGEFIVCSNALS